MTPLPAHAFKHSVQFYDNNQALLNTLTEYFQEGLQANETCIIVGTPEHRSALHSALESVGYDLAFAKYISLSFPQIAKSSPDRFQCRVQR